MIRLEVLGGSKAGAVFAASRFPIRLGRASSNDIILEDSGVWPSHLSICREGDDAILQVETDAMLQLNGEPVQRKPLRNGDIIGVGSVNVQFSFTAVRQSSLAFRESLTWVMLVALGLGEVAIAYALW
ncbi:MAG TPA: FHA domain-containing protein [Verrucomicrobiae bacterium]|jgi:pSer/pThr/pTyr-binding forkhead associated (FHA) protein|nr:FHA domain-containing protein [Verrucomicrobiae bacterium]